MKTPPGTKVRLSNAVRLSRGFLLLDAKSLVVLGGEVADLLHEWRIQQVHSVQSLPTPIHFPPRLHVQWV